MKAYVFNFEDQKTVGVLAYTHDEAVEVLKNNYLKSNDPNIEYSTPECWNTAVAELKKGKISYYKDDRRVTQKGYYVFLSGIFFTICMEYRKIAHCRVIYTNDEIIAVINNDNHYIEPEE